MPESGDDLQGNDRKIAATNGNIGGQGVVTVLADPHHSRSDIGLVRQAQRRRWEVSEDKKPLIIRRLLGIVRKTEVTVAGGEGGPQTVECPADRNSISAAKALIAMEGQNQADEHKAKEQGQALFAPIVIPIVIRSRDDILELAELKKRLAAQGVASQGNDNQQAGDRPLGNENA